MCNNIYFLHTSKLLGGKFDIMSPPLKIDDIPPLPRDRRSCMYLLYGPAQVYMVGQNISIYQANMRKILGQKSYAPPSPTLVKVVPYSDYEGL